MLTPYPLDYPLTGDLHLSRASLVRGVSPSITIKDRRGLSTTRDQAFPRTEAKASPAAWPQLQETHVDIVIRVEHHKKVDRAVSAEGLTPAGREALAELGVAGRRLCFIADTPALVRGARLGLLSFSVLHDTGR